MQAKKTSQRVLRLVGRMLTRSLRVVASTSWKELGTSSLRGSRSVPRRVGRGRDERGGGDRRREERRTLEDVVVPVKLSIRREPGAENVGEEMAGKLDKNAVNRVLSKFAGQQSIRTALYQQGLTDKLFHKAFVGVPHLLSGVPSAAC